MKDGYIWVALGLFLIAFGCWAYGQYMEHDKEWACPASALAIIGGIITIGVGALRL